MTDVDDATALRPGEPASPALPPLRHSDADELNPEFVTALADAVAAADGERVRALMRDLHEADVGALLEALDPDDRPRLIELMGREVIPKFR